MGSGDWGTYLHMQAKGPDDWSHAEQDAETGDPQTGTYEMCRADITVMGTRTITWDGDVMTTEEPDPEDLIARVQQVLRDHPPVED